MKLLWLLLVIMLAGCHLIGPLREYNPENKVNSPHDPNYQPPADERPIINQHTGQPRKPGESIQ